LKEDKLLSFIGWFSQTRLGRLISFVGVIVFYALHIQACRRHKDKYMYYGAEKERNPKLELQWRQFFG
jgi:hypothetical protein